jgi:hypothetical protein
MSTRITARTVLFRHPFVLGGFERVEPAGSYLVETEEEEIDGATVAVSVWRRIGVVMHIRHGGMTECMTIDPDDLEKALVRDAEGEEPHAALMARLEADRMKKDARLQRHKML